MQRKLYFPRVASELFSVETPFFGGVSMPVINFSFPKPCVSSQRERGDPVPKIV